MREIMMREAITEALREEMRSDERVFILGEGIIDPWGGTFRATLGLSTEFGPERVRETPISEAAIVGCAVGAAMLGMRPVAELMFMDFSGIAMDQIANQAAKLRYMTGGQIGIPMVLRTASGAGRAAAAQHSQSLESWFLHIPGLKVVVPSTPYDAKGLLKSAIRDPDPVVFIEHKMIYATKGPVPEEDYVIPLGVADVKRVGTDATVVAYSRQVHRALAAAETVASEGIEVEVVDPRSLFPLDLATIVESVKKTGRLVIVHEASERGGFGAELAAQVMREAFDYLDGPIIRVASANTPLPFAPVMENLVLPDEGRIVAAIRQSLG